jgi:hypothetical protein
MIDRFDAKGATSDQVKKMFAARCAAIAWKCG